MSFINYLNVQKELPSTTPTVMANLSQMLLRLETAMEELGECSGVVSENIALARIINAINECARLKESVLNIYGETICTSFCEELNYDDIVQTARALLKSKDDAASTDASATQEQLDVQCLKRSIEDVFTKQLHTLQTLHSEMITKVTMTMGRPTQATLFTAISIKAKLEAINDIIDIAQASNAQRQSLDTIAQSIKALIR